MKKLETTGKIAPPAVTARRRRAGDAAPRFFTLPFAS
jgi:hypothetical protein